MKLKVAVGYMHYTNFCCHRYLSVNITNIFCTFHMLNNYNNNHHHHNPVGTVLSSHLLVRRQMYTCMETNKCTYRGHFLMDFCKITSLIPKDDLITDMHLIVNQSASLTTNNKLMLTAIFTHWVHRCIQSHPVFSDFYTVCQKKTCDYIFYNNLNNVPLQ